MGLDKASVFTLIHLSPFLPPPGVPKSPDYRDSISFANLSQAYLLGQVPGPELKNTLYLSQGDKSQCLLVQPQRACAQAGEAQHGGSQEGFPEEGTNS